MAVWRSEPVVRRWGDEVEVTLRGRASLLLPVKEAEELAVMVLVTSAGLSDPAQARALYLSIRALLRGAVEVAGERP